MFVTETTYASSFPGVLGANDGSQYWRAFRVALHAPWFLLTLGEPSTQGISAARRTLCIARDIDLVDALEGLHAVKPLGLARMAPSAQSDTGHWSSTEIREVWAAEIGTTKMRLVFRDVRGQEFIHRLRPMTPGDQDELRLISRVGSAA